MTREEMKAAADASWGTVGAGGASVGGSAGTESMEGGGMSVLNLTVGVVPGSDINDAFEHSAALAQIMSLAWVNFDFNGDKCTAYPDGRGVIFRGCSIVGRWTRKDGIQWE